MLYIESANASLTEKTVHKLLSYDLSQEADGIWQDIFTEFPSSYKYRMYNLN